MAEWAPPANYYQSPQPPVQANTGEWAPPTTYYQSPPPVPNTHQGQWGVPTATNLQLPLQQQQQQWAPPMHYSGAPSLPSNASPLAGHFAPTNTTSAPPVSGVSHIELTIPPKYHGNVVDKQGTKVYHLSTANASSTVISRPNGTIAGRIDWNKKENHTTIIIDHSKWQRGELLHLNNDKTYTFRVKAGGYTWKGFRDGIQCFDPTGSKMAEFPYRTESIITLDPAHAAHMELVIITALLIHHEKSHLHEGIFGKLGESVSEGTSDAIGEAVVKGLLGAAF